MRRAQRASELLNDPLLAECVYAIEQTVIDEMRKAKLDDVEYAVRLITALQISASVRKHLWHLLQDGHAAQQRLDLRGKRID